MKVRVLQVLATLKRAGAERVAVSIVNGLDREKFEPAVVSLYEPYPGGFEPELEARQVPVWHLDKRPGLDPRMWRRLARVFRRFRPHVVHTHSYVLRYVWPAVWGRRVQIVHTIHNLAEREVDLVGRRIHRAVFRGGGVPVAISLEIGRSFERVYGFPAGLIITNGTDTRHGFRADAREEWRAANGFGPDDLLVVSVARLEPQKNPLGLMEAFRTGLASRPEARLIFAGQGSLLEECRKRAAALGLADRVRLPGLCQDVPTLLSACDVFALASDWEGAPVSVIEAMAAHLPAVATAVGGVPDLVEDGSTGLLVPAGDMQAMGAALLALASDPGRRSAMGAAAAQRSARFDVTAMVDAYAALYQGLVR